MSVVNKQLIEGLNGNNIRGGKYQTQTRVFLVGGLIEKAANEAGFHLYDRRVWGQRCCMGKFKMAYHLLPVCDEFEYIYIILEAGNYKGGSLPIDETRMGELGVKSGLGNPFCSKQC